MRNILALIKTEFGKENVIILRRWEHLEKKIANSVTMEESSSDVSVRQSPQTA